MSTVKPGTSNTLLPGLGGANANPGNINWGAISTAPKNTALNNAKSGTSTPFPTFSGGSQPFSIPASSTGLMNSNSGGATTPTLASPSYKPLAQTPIYGAIGQQLNPFAAKPPANPQTQPTTAANWNLPQGNQGNSGLVSPMISNNIGAQPQYSPSGGAIVPQFSGSPAQPTPQQSNQQSNSYEQPTPTPSSIPAPPPPTPTAPQNANQTQPNMLPNTPAGYAQSLAQNSMVGSPIAGTAAAGLLSTTNSPLVQGLLSDYQKKAAEAQQFQQQLAQQEQNVTGQAIPGGIMAGEQSQLERNYGIQEQALANQANIAQQALTSGIAEQGAQQTGFNEAGNLGLQGQQLLQSGLTSAGGLVQPSSQFTQVSPGNYLADSSGQGVAGGMQQGIANLTSLGQAQQNIAGGQGLQGQAQQLAPVLQQLKGTGSQVTGLLQASGLNPTNVPIANQLASPYFKQQNPAAAASVQKGLADISSYIGQILSTNSGLTPTEVTSLTDTSALESLSPQQLQVLLSNVDQLGQTRLQSLQQGAQANYGANYGGGAAYSGPPTNPGQLSNAGATNSPLISGAAMAGSGVIGTLGKFADQLGSFVSENAILGIGAALFE